MRVRERGFYQLMTQLQAHCFLIYIDEVITNGWEEIKASSIFRTGIGMMSKDVQ